MNLSPHFTLDEMTFSEIALRNGLSNSPDKPTLSNLKRLAELLEKVRLLLNKPIRINSAYRSLNVNKLVGGQSNSQHCLGCAADIKVGDMTPDQVVKAIIHSDIPYDQIIREFDSWVHISIPNGVDVKPRKNALIIDKQGTRAYA